MSPTSSLEAAFSDARELLASWSAVIDRILVTSATDERNRALALQAQIRQLIAILETHRVDCREEAPPEYLKIIHHLIRAIAMQVPRLDEVG